MTNTRQPPSSIALLPLWPLLTACYSGADLGPAPIDYDDEEVQRIIESTNDEARLEELGILCIHELPDEETLAAPDVPRQAFGDAPKTLQEAFTLHCNPGASKVIHLDFDGHVTTNTSWNSSYGSALTTPPAWEGKSDSERAAKIYETFVRVCEDFAPFDVDVTTEEPPLEHLRKDSSTDERWGVRVAIGGSSWDWFRSAAGGVAYVGAFDWDSDTPVFTFLKEVGNNPALAAEATSHEAGHALGLVHWPEVSGGDWKPGSYYSGHGSGETSWAPIMGVAYGKSLTQWSNGEYSGLGGDLVWQDDLEIITSDDNGFGFRRDDHGNTRGNASNLSHDDGVVEDFGRIHGRNDIDVLKFEHDGGPVEFYVEPAPRGFNLDLSLSVLDGSGSRVASSNPQNEVSSTIVRDLPSGTYFLEIDGAGQGDPVENGYSDYGSLGEYKVWGLFNPRGQSSGSTVIRIEAGGQACAGDPVMAVFVKNEEQGRFTVTENASAGETGTYVVELGRSVSFADIEIRFANDHRQAEVCDRNLFVDKVRITDGSGSRVRETEDPRVLSTGTWVKGTGCSEDGNFEHEWLHCSGSFFFE